MATANTRCAHHRVPLMAMAGGAFEALATSVKRSPKGFAKRLSQCRCDSQSMPKQRVVNREKQGRVEHTESQVSSGVHGIEDELVMEVDLTPYCCRDGPLRKATQDPGDAVVALSWSGLPSKWPIASRARPIPWLIPRHGGVNGDGDG